MEPKAECSRSASYHCGSQIIFCAMPSSSRGGLYTSGRTKRGILHFPQHHSLNFAFKMYGGCGELPDFLCLCHPQWLPSQQTLSAHHPSLLDSDFMDRCMCQCSCVKGKATAAKRVTQETQASCLCRDGNPGQSSPMTCLPSSLHIHLAGKPIGPGAEH